MSATAPRPGQGRLVLLVPDGACEPGVRTSLERARTRHLDALCSTQGVGRLRTIPAGHQPGTEVGVSRLLGLTGATPGRGWLEAAAVDVEVAPGRAAWRLDLTSGIAAAARLEAALRRTETAEVTDDVEVHPLTDRRHLLVGPARWGDAAPGHDQELPTAWRRRLAAVEDALDVRVHAWGRAQQPPLPTRRNLAVLPDSAAVRGLARGVDATLLSDLDDALAAIASARHDTVLIHDAGPDEAAHDRDPAAKRAALERFDETVVGPIVAAATAAGAAILVAPDHGCDPATGAHTAEPVPATWPGAPGTGRMTEPATCGLPVADAAATALALAPTWMEAA